MERSGYPESYWAVPSFSLGPLTGAQGFMWHRGPRGAPQPKNVIPLCSCGGSRRASPSFPPHPPFTQGICYLVFPLGFEGAEPLSRSGGPKARASTPCALCTINLYYYVKFYTKLTPILQAQSPVFPIPVTSSHPIFTKKIIFAFHIA